MCPYRAAALAVTAGLLLPSVAFACMWDYDTIKMERTRFPSTLELITGKFLRHSPEFYRWRIENRLRRLEADPTNAALLDDLAAAYDKTGQHEKAIETAQKTEKLHPGRYETAANLGTFYFHAGKLEEGIPHIDRALKINPDAHFGREKYQKLLVEYVIERKKGGPLKLPLADVAVHPGTVRESPSAHEVEIKSTFVHFLPPKGRYQLTAEESAPAVKGILGMMKFGKHDAPVLLETLGALLTQGASDPTADAKLLAARAFLKASYEAPEEPARTAYRGMAARAIQMQTLQRDQLGQISLEQVETDFQKELEEGRAWYAELRARELSWIRDGKDPEVEFDALYESEPEVSGMDARDPMSPKTRFGILLGTLFAIVCLSGLAGIALVVRHFWRTQITHKTGRATPT